MYAVNVSFILLCLAVLLVEMPFGGKIRCTCARCITYPAALTATESQSSCPTRFVFKRSCPKTGITTTR